jgi:prevent-host-death family protein
MSTISLEEAQARLPELIEHLTAGEEIVITREGKPVGRLLPPELPKGVPIPGRCRGMLTIVSEDDEHLKDFAEYM